MCKGDPDGTHFKNGVYRVGGVRLLGKLHGVSQCFLNNLWNYYGADNRQRPKESRMNSTYLVTNFGNSIQVAHKPI